jgi:ribonuclease T2
MTMKILLRCAAIGALALAAHAADFSYYMLALSYAPDFCAEPGGNKDPRECGPGRPGFVVHGLWPQNDGGRGPEKCGPARPVAADLVRVMLNYIPTESLIQHEWTTHGTCSGLSAADYFAAVRKARDSIRIPQRLEALQQTLSVSPQELESEFGAANPGLVRNGLRTSCYADGGLQEVRICFDKSLATHPCVGVNECTKSTVRLLPPLAKR